MHLSVEMMGSLTKMTVSWAVLVQPVACFSRKYALASARLEVGAPRELIQPCQCGSLGPTPVYLMSLLTMSGAHEYSVQGRQLV